MNWLLIVIVAYFLNSVAMLIDKKLLGKAIADSVVYTFYVGISSIIILPFLLPFGISLPALLILLLAFIAGLFFIGALFLMYRALLKEDVSRVTPFIGSLTPLFIFLFALVFLEESLTKGELTALLFLLLGGFLVSLDLSKSPFFPFKSLGFALFSALCFAASYALTKYVYNYVNFATGFFWLRLGASAGALSILAIPGSWQKIIANFKKNKQKTSPLFFIGQIFGGVSALLLSFAISLAPVTLVNSLQGLQYGFLFFLIYFFTRYWPHFLKEKINLTIVLQKTVAIILISSGLFILSTGL